MALQQDVGEVQLSQLNTPVQENKYQGLTTMLGFAGQVAGDLIKDKAESQKQDFFANTLQPALDKERDLLEQTGNSSRYQINTAKIRSQYMQSHPQYGDDVSDYIRATLSTGGSGKLVMDAVNEEKQAVAAEQAAQAAAVKDQNKAARDYVIDVLDKNGVTHLAYNKSLPEMIQLATPLIEKETVTRTRLNALEMLKTDEDFDKISQKKMEKENFVPGVALLTSDATGQMDKIIASDMSPDEKALQLQAISMGFRNAVSSTFTESGDQVTNAIRGFSDLTKAYEDLARGKGDAQELDNILKQVKAQQAALQNRELPFKILEGQINARQFGYDVLQDAVKSGAIPQSQISEVTEAMAGLQLMNLEAAQMIPEAINNPDAWIQQMTSITGTMSNGSASGMGKLFGTGDGNFRTVSAGAGAAILTSKLAGEEQKMAYMNGASPYLLKPEAATMFKDNPELIQPFTRQLATEFNKELAEYKQIAGEEFALRTETTYSRGGAPVQTYSPFTSVQLDTDKLAQGVVEFVPLGDETPENLATIERMNNSFAPKMAKVIKKYAHATGSQDYALAYNNILSRQSEGRDMPSMSIDYKTYSANPTNLNPRAVERISRYNDSINKHAEKQGLDPALLKGLIYQESRGKADAVSPVGARGLTQVMEETAKSAGFGIPNNFDVSTPDKQIEFGARYLRKLIDKFGNEEMALAAYNAGPGAVSKYGGIPPYSETQKYVPSVLAHASAFQGQGETEDNQRKEEE